MTILSKDKLNKGKSEETSESVVNHGGSYSRNLAIGSLPNLSQNTEGMVQSSHWSRGEKRTMHSNSGKENSDEHETGPSQTKRRHRVSPNRTTRNKLRETISPSSPPFSQNNNVASSSPTAGPSGLVNENVHSHECNSDDEYGSLEAGHISNSEWLERDRWFEKNIRRKGFVVKQMEQDGACLFRAVADQVYGDQEMNDVVRSHCMDYIAANRDYFSQYVTEDFQAYVDRKRQQYVHGNHIEIQAMSEMYNRTVEVFYYGMDPINIFFGKHKNDNEPIRLSYHRGTHYNSIVDPYKPTVGVGLGLPSYTPGLAESNLMKEAVSQSERLHVEEAMLEDKLRATDWETTNEAIEEQVARESYLQWLRDNEQRNNKVHKSNTETLSTATITSDNIRSSPKTRATNSHSPSEGQCSSSAGCSWHEMPNVRQGFLETATYLNRFSPQVFGVNKWENGILAEVLATSQQEYIERLKKTCDINDRDSAISKNFPTADTESPTTSN